MVKLIQSFKFLLASLFTPTKGSHMESRIGKIDVKRDHKELISLYYYMELKSLVQRLLYEQEVGRLRYK